MLRKEAEMLALLKARGVKGVPEIFSSVLDSETRGYIVSTLMHVSLFELGRRLRRDALEADVCLVAREAGLAITVRNGLITPNRFLSPPKGAKGPVGLICNPFDSLDLEMLLPGCAVSAPRQSNFAQ